MNEEPYVGPRSFTVADRDRFFGRKDEIDEVVSLVMAHPVVIIYALSGVGKSSLISAGVVPTLRKERFAALPPARVEGVIPAGLDPKSIRNQYVFQALSCWLDQQEVPFCAAEEVTELSVSQFVDAWMAARPEELEDSAPVLVFDQFEEIFTGAEARWNEREEFFTQLGEAMATHRRLKIVFALREEFVARLEPFAKKFPRALRTRKRLERLRAPAALSAITRPVEKFGLTYEPGVAEKLVQDLLGSGDDDGSGATVGEFVEPVQLQVVCRNLWEKLPAELKQPAASGEPRRITHEHLQAAGEVTTALASYYDEAIRAAVTASGVRERRLRLWFSGTLVGSDGTSLGMAVKGQAETAAIPVEAIRALREKYLIRHEKRGIAEWYELAHARFIRPVLSSNESWFAARRESEILRRKFLQRAVELNQGDRLFDDRRELEEVEAFLSSVDAQERSEFEALEKLAKRSRHELDRLTGEREREARRQEEVNKLRIRIIRLGTVLVVGLAIMVVVAGIGFWHANESARAARISAAKAEQSEKDARASARFARAQALAIRAGVVSSKDPECAIMLAVSSMDVQETTEGIAAMHRALIASQIRMRMPGLGADTGSVMGVAYSPDGSSILTGGVDRKVRIWNARTAAFIGYLGGDSASEHQGWVWSIAFSPDGTRVATSGADGEVRVWPFPAPADGAWTPAATFQHRKSDGTPTTVQRVVFDSTGARLLACCQDGSAHVWNVPAGKEVLRLAGHKGFVRSGAFHPTRENLAVTAGVDNRVRVWDLDAPATPDPATPDAPPTIHPLAEFPPAAPEEQGLWDVAFNADGSQIVTAGADHVSRIWDFETRSILANLEGHDGAVLIAKFVNDETVLTTSIDKSARLWTIAKAESPGRPVPAAGETQPLSPVIPVQYLTVQATTIFRGHTDFVRNAVVSPDGRHLTTTGRDGTVRVWAMPPGFEVALLRSDYIIREAAFRKGGAEIVTAAGFTAVVWDLRRANGALPRITLEGHTDIIRSVAYSADGTRLATASDDGSARIWNADTGEQIGLLPGGPRKALQSVSFDPSGRRVAVGGDNGFAAVWDSETGALVSIAKGRESVRAVCFSPDGKRVVTAGYDQYARIWDPAGGEPLFISTKHDDILLDAAFSPDGKLLVTGCATGDVMLFDPARGKDPLEILKRHEGQVRKARFFQFTPVARESGSAPEMRTALLTAGFDGTVRMWEKSAASKPWEVTQEFTGAAGPVYAIAASEDGLQIVAGGADRFGRIYYRDGYWLWNLARTRVTRDYTPEERAEYGIGDDE